ncbi:MAG: hypothetical protein J3R72DRAFT_527904 [Linnemannia gamsii]|nr:MAG: hypothetical protein J3R72DRAFT_527904 [Linnemannia gamsii]
MSPLTTAPGTQAFFGGDGHHDWANQTMICPIIIVDSPSPEPVAVLRLSHAWRGGRTGLELTEDSMPKCRILRGGWEVMDERPKSGVFICTPKLLQDIPYVVDMATILRIYDSIRNFPETTATERYINFHQGGPIKHGWKMRTESRSGFYFCLKADNKIDFHTFAGVAETVRYSTEVRTMITWIKRRVQPVNSEFATMLESFFRDHLIEDELPRPLDYLSILSFADTHWLTGEAMDGIASYFQRFLGVGPDGEKNLFVDATTMQIWTWRAAHDLPFHMDDKKRIMAIGDIHEVGVTMDADKYLASTAAVQAFIISYFPFWDDIDTAPLLSLKVPAQDGFSCGVVAAYAVEHLVLHNNACHGWEAKNVPIYRAAYLARVMGYKMTQGHPILAIAADRVVRVSSSPKNRNPQPMHSFKHAAKTDADDDDEDTGHQDPFDWDFNFVNPYAATLTFFATIIVA